MTLDEFYPGAGVTLDELYPILDDLRYSCISKLPNNRKTRTAVTFLKQFSSQLCGVYLGGCLYVIFDVNPQFRIFAINIAALLT